MYFCKKILMEKELYKEIILNIQKIMRDRNLTQTAISEYMGVTPSHYSKIVSGKVKMSIEQLSNVAKGLSMREIDVITYPDKYVKIEQKQSEPIEAILQIKLQKDKKDQVLKMLFGENNLEVLNK